MSLEVKIPSVGESITSGVISAWHKAEGEAVTKGDTLLTLDTDKVSTDLAAEESGVIHLKAAVGDEVSIGQVVAIIEVGTASAAAPFVRAAVESKRSTRLLPRSATKTFPVVGSTATEDGSASSKR